MAVMSSGVLFDELRSPLVTAVTVWVTEGAPLLSTATARVNVVDEAGSRIAAVEHDTVDPAAEQDHPAPAALTKDSPLGSTSTTLIVPLVGTPPTFLTVIE